MDLAEMLFETFRESGRQLFLVGGTVRDRLLGLPPGDLDFATDASPEETSRILHGAGIRTLDIGRRFGTITALVDGPDGVGRAEITTYRSERYEKGSRKPGVRFGCSLEADLLRRDFTVNAIAMGPDGSLVDPSGGVADLAAGVLRTPGDPFVTIAEDPLRSLRAARFSGRFGFSVQADLAGAVRREAGALRDVSVERWLRELDSMLEAPDGEGAAACMRCLVDLGLLPVVLPEIAPLASSDGEDPGEHHVQGVWSHTLCVLAKTPPRLVPRWAALFHDAGKPFRRTVDAGGSVHFHGHPEIGAELAMQAGGRLRFPRARRMDVAGLVRLHQRPAEYSPGWGDGAVRRLARDAGDLLEDLLVLSEADSACRAPGSAGDRAVRLAELRRRLRMDPVASSGRLVPGEVGEFLARDLGPGGGRETGALLAVLEEMVLSGSIPPDAGPEVFLEALGRYRRRSSGSPSEKSEEGSRTTDGEP